MRQERVYTPVQQDDLAKYEERYTEQERDELRIASLAHDIVFLRNRAKRQHGSRAVVTIAVPWHDLGLQRLARYLEGLGERVRITEQELETGRYVQIEPLGRQVGGATQSATALAAPNEHIRATND